MELLDPAAAAEGAAAVVVVCGAVGEGADTRAQKRSTIFGAGNYGAGALALRFMER